MISAPAGPGRNTRNAAWVNLKSSPERQCRQYRHVQRNGCNMHSWWGRMLKIGAFHFDSLHSDITHFECRRCAQCCIQLQKCTRLKDNLCSIYEKRPLGCRVFPFFIAWNVSEDERRTVVHWQECIGLSNQGENNIGSFIPSLEEVWKQCRESSGQ